MTEEGASRLRHKEMPLSCLRERASHAGSSAEGLHFCWVIGWAFLTWPTMDMRSQEAGNIRVSTNYSQRELERVDSEPFRSNLFLKDFELPKRAATEPISEKGKKKKALLLTHIYFNVNIYTSRILYFF